MANEKPSDRKFGLMFAVVFGVSGAWLILKHDGRAPWFFSGGLLFLLAAVFTPAVLGPLNKIWMKLGEFLHKMVSPVILGVIFYLLFTPIGVVRRFLGIDALKLRYEPKRQSYWNNRTERISADSFNDQF